MADNSVHPLRNEVKTAGIRSEVCIDGKIFPKTVGHVLFLDIEDSTLEEVKETLEEHNSAISSYFIFQSSDNNFHVINTAVKACSVVHYMKEGIRIDDDKHNRIGYDKRAWVLRITSKGSKTDPKLVESCINEAAWGRVHSQPHLEYLYRDHDAVKAKGLLRRGETVGETLKTVRYGTYEKHR